jgi:hypothetical protein
MLGINALIITRENEVIDIRGPIERSEIGDIIDHDIMSHIPLDTTTLRDGIIMRKVKNP